LCVGRAGCRDVALSASPVRYDGLCGCFVIDDEMSDGQAPNRGREERCRACGRGALELRQAKLPGALADQPVQHLVCRTGYSRADAIPMRH
jgi:hypothetical protein